MYFESHAHYDNKQFESDRNVILNEAYEKGVKYIVNIGSDVASSQVGVGLSKSYSFVYASVGVHPHDVKDIKDGDMQVLHLLSKEEKVVAIGEIGLDFYYDNSPRDMQKYWFCEQLKLVKETSLPVIIHCREADGYVYDILYDTALNRKKGVGVMHCYSGSYELAKKYIDMGYYLGIGGVLTYKNAKKLVEVVSKVPLKHLLIETDAPFLSPVPNRGRRNDSTNLHYIVNEIAKIKNITAEEVAEVTMRNSKKFFDIN